MTETRTTPKRVLIIQGHPHGEAMGGGGHFCHALADAYAEGAASAGAKVARLDLGSMDMNMLRDPAEFETEPPPAVRKAQIAVTEAEHLVILYPLWLGTMPAVVKAFFEQLCRNSFAIEMAKDGEGWPRRMLTGRSARVVVTMGMPAAAYRVFFGADGVKGFESGVLAMAGIKPVRETLIGLVGAMSPKQLAAKIASMRRLGEKLG